MELINVKTLNFHQCEVTINNVTVVMAETSAKILQLLALTPNKVQTRDDITFGVWGHTFISPRSVDIAILKIRKKLGSGVIETARGGIGYKFTGELGFDTLQKTKVFDY